MKPVRVLIVDDSATMRGLIAATLSRDPAIQVVGQVGDALEARAAVKALNPDVMTLDVEMPSMNGLEFLQKVMRLRPFPVVMVSSLTERGAATALSALEIGAVDCVRKPCAESPNAFDELPLIVRTAATARLGAAGVEHKKSARTARHQWNGDIVAIGASTGCVEALMALVPHFPEDCPPTVMAVHMPGEFTQSFARRLDATTAAQVREARDGAPLERGVIHLAPGSRAHLIVAPSASGEFVCSLHAGPQVNGHRPSVDVLFRSVAASCGPKAVGAILTGMGRDGAEGLLEMRRAGASTLGQNEASCVVYGMPKVAARIGAVEEELPIGAIGPRLLQLTSRSNTRS
jgi:two-component system chemotaxis response regulator CheB